MSALSDLLQLSQKEKHERGIEHTPQEIAQQPETWAATFSLFQQRRKEVIELLQSSGIFKPPNERPIVFLVGAGTSDYIGRSLVLLLRQQWDCEVAAVPSTDLVTHFHEIVLPHKSYLWISFSRSGDSPESVAAIDKAREARPDIHHLIVTCNPDGQMVSGASKDSRAMGICLADRVNDRGLAMTSSFSNMVILGQCLAHSADLGDYRGTLASMIRAGTAMLRDASDLAFRLSRGPFTSACFVGSGSLRAVASECGLKLLELTAGRIPTLSESALGLRHGPMSALNRETLFTCFLSRDARVRNYETDLLDEIGTKGLVNTRVAIGPNGTGAQAEHLLTVDSDVPDLYRPACDAIFGQLLGLFFSLRCDLKPDRPSLNGAISRVVQGVKIYA